MVLNTPMPIKPLTKGNAQHKPHKAMLVQPNFLKKFVLLDKFFTSFLIYIYKAKHWSIVYCQENF